MVKRFLKNTNNIERAAYIWNTSASMLNAFQTVLILMVISRIDSVSDAGIFTIAFAIGNLMLTLGMYGTRQFQVSDVKNKYSFCDYLSARGITCLIMVIVSIGYVGVHYVRGMYTREKSLIIMFVCFAKAVDAFEDVFHGMFQQRGRLDIAGKILFLRLFSYIITYLCCYIATASLITASLISLIVSAVISLALNSIAIRTFDYEQSPFLLSNVMRLLIECFPLFISSYLAMYIVNAPKYAIDKVLGNEAQACFNYIFMPVFVIGLLSQFVYQPIIGRLSLMWHRRDMKDFYKLILRQCVIIGMLSGFVLSCGYLLGIPVLSLVFGVDLSGYRSHFMVLLVSGVFLAYVYFFQMIMTVIRRQTLLTIGYCAVYIIFLVFGGTIVHVWGLMGISLFYMMALAVLGFLFMVMAVINVMLSKKV